MSSLNFGFTTTADGVSAVLADEIRGKNVLVTGTSINGIGFDTARSIARYANLVIITGYNAERLKLTEEAIKKEIPTANVRPLILDLSSLAAVRKAAAEVNAYSEPLHVLIHNAAAALIPTFKPSAEGFESQVAAGHLGPFLITKLLLPKILSAGADTPRFTPRVVFVSSGVQSWPIPIDFADLGNTDPAKYDQLAAYKLTKCANIVTAIELSKRSGGRINAYSLHPGTIHTNIQQKPEVVPMLQQLGMLKEDGTPNHETRKWKTIPQGAATNVAAAFDPRLNDTSGAYLEDCNEANKRLSPFCLDPANGEKLWKISEELIGEKFEI